MMRGNDDVARASSALLARSADRDSVRSDFCPFVEGPGARHPASAGCHDVGPAPALADSPRDGRTFERGGAEGGTAGSGGGEVRGRVGCECGEGRGRACRQRERITSVAAQGHQRARTCASLSVRANPDRRCDSFVRKPDSCSRPSNRRIFQSWLLPGHAKSGRHSRGRD
jgi:hypothetical protein